MDFWEKVFFALEQTPYRGAAITVFRRGADGITSLESEVLLDGMYGSVVVVFGLAELDKAATKQSGS